MRKLIRNKIPYIAEQKGNRKGMTLEKFGQNDAELILLFKQKIIEEANEINETNNDIDLVYEIADLWQVMNELTCYLGIDDKNLTNVIKAKAYTHGTFISDVKTYADIKNESGVEDKKVTEVYTLNINERERDN